MRAVLSQAFVADHRISPWRFVGACGAISVVMALLGGWAGSKAHLAGEPALGAAAFATAAAGGVMLFLGLLATAGPLWWLLWRMRWRGWAASLLAGALLVCGVEVAYWAAMIAIGGVRVAADSSPLWLMVLFSAPLGLGLGWIFWRIAVRPAPEPVAAFE